ncbi:MAG: DUF2849 domain-containing protein [Proteobacteria bacterium]|nr:DUF2849 domain-containing protein [Pseudomonadota bacterium]
MKLLTGNDLKSGAVIWWDGTGWSLHVEQAADVGGEGDVIAAREGAARRVVAAYVVEAEGTPQGPRPLHIKERIRAIGPTVRPDLALRPADPALGEWVI